MMDLLKNYKKEELEKKQNTKKRIKKRQKHF